MCCLLPFIHCELWQAVKAIEGTLAYDLGKSRHNKGGRVTFMCNAEERVLIRNLSAQVKTSA